MDVLSYGPERFPQPISAAVRGEVDLATAEDLLLRLRMLAGPATGEITLDLSQVTFIDCSGLRALLALDHQLRTVGGRVWVTALSPQVARLFELVGPYGDGHDLLAPPALGRTAPRHRPRRRRGSAADGRGVTLAPRPGTRR
jgi:anti-anti-sigma factor